ncbi:MAG: S8 family serine peptidase, partial [Krumholzibacteria bacterium]|nr:S8 family serine peptidase [Candidatus Krumholzibacteria bacterium]
AAVPAGDKAAAGLDYGYNTAAMVQAGVVAAHAAGLRGRGVTVGLLDTGFRTVHEAFSGLPVLDTWDFVNGDPVVDDEPGDPAGSRNHGTMVLSTLAARRPGHLLGPAPDVAVLLAKTEDISQEVPAEEDHWVAGLEWLEASGADLVTSSLAYLDWYTFAELDGATAVTTIAADQAVARGLVVVNSAGNYRTTTGTIAAPADGFGVIAVGAVDAAGATTWFSSPGPTADGRIKPDVAARGAGNPVASPDDPFAYVQVSGTSFSGPLVAGVAALVLERAPGLSPGQVAEALRTTASRSAAPDNDQGWGIVDAWAAATYWGPVYAHAPLRDSEDTTGPYDVGAVITARSGLDDLSLAAYWRADGGPWQAAALAPTGGEPSAYAAQIPGQPAGTSVQYYLTGTDLAGVTVTEPVRAPGRVHAFTVGPDTTPPQLAHVPLSDHTLFAWPPTVRCTARDNLGLDAVELTWRLNGGALQGPVPLVPGAEDAWSLPFPLAVGAVADGDVVSYAVTARDLAAAANTTVAGEHTFTVRALAQADTLLAEAPSLFIPDGQAPGLTRILSLDPGAAGTILALQVGIAIMHPAPEQLLVELYAPDGTVVTLHDHGGAGTTDLAGTWPLDLAVAGPGSLDDLVGRPAAGPWLLAVTDDQAGEVGTLESWSLALTLTPGVSSTGDTPAVPFLGGLAGAPNPFNPRTGLGFTLERPARVTLTIYDLRGMLVRRLLDERLDTGTHRVDWDGRDRSGRTVASGVYVARLAADGAVRERKLTLVR